MWSSTGGNRECGNAVIMAMPQLLPQLCAVCASLDYATGFDWEGKGIGRPFEESIGSENPQEIKDMKPEREWDFDFSDGGAKRKSTRKRKKRRKRVKKRKTRKIKSGKSGKSRKR